MWLVSTVWLWPLLFAVVSAKIVPGENQQLLQPAAPPKTIPLIGFGTWNLREKNTSEAVAWAIESGYRHIDAAAIYGNEKEVGAGIAAGLHRTGLSRDDLWITSKLWNDHHDPALVDNAITKTLQDLGIAYLDLYHMHWPVSDPPVSEDHAIEYTATWHAMAELIPKGLTRHIGVANFSPSQLRHLLTHSEHRPAVHQMELHPYLPQPRWLKFHAEHGIYVTAYSPLAGTNPTYAPGADVPLLKNPVVSGIAAARECTSAQVALSWGVQRGTSVIPKSVHADRIVENLRSEQCILTAADVQKIDRLGDLHHRYNNPSKQWAVPLFQGLEDWDGKHHKEDF